MWLLALLALTEAQAQQPAASVQKDIVTGTATDELVLSAPRTGVTLKLKGNTLSSATINVSRYDGNSIRGNYKTQTVDIHWTDDRVSGMIGAGSQLNLKVRKTEEGIKVDGMYRGVTSHFRIGYGILDGRIGSCRYNLVAQTDEYEGTRTCDFSSNFTEPVSLRLPKKLTQRPAAELVAFLAVAFLAQRD